MRLFLSGWLCICFCVTTSGCLVGRTEHKVRLPELRVEGKVVGEDGRPLPGKEVVLIAPRQKSAGREAARALFDNKPLRGPAYQALTAKTDETGAFHTAFPPHTRRINAPYILLRSLSPKRHARDVTLYIKAANNPEAHEILLRKRGIRVYRLLDARNKPNPFERYAETGDHILAKGRRNDEKDTILFTLRAK